MVDTYIYTYILFLPLIFIFLIPCLPNSFFFLLLLLLLNQVLQLIFWSSPINTFMAFHVRGTPKLSTCNYERREGGREEGREGRREGGREGGKQREGGI